MKKKALRFNHGLSFNIAKVIVKQQNLVGRR